MTTRVARERGAEILSVGLTCAVGLRAPFAAAAVRAGIMKFEESDTFDRRGQPFVQARVPLARLPKLPQTPASLTAYETKLVRLAFAAASEALAPVTHLLASEPRHGSMRAPHLGGAPVQRRSAGSYLPVTLALPGAHPGLAPLARPDPCLRTLMASLHIDPAQARTVTRGRASGLLALGEAISCIEAGEPLALAVAADSFDEPDLLAALDHEDRVRADGVYDGFTPGEAGASILLAAHGTAARLGRPLLGHVDAVTTADEPGHRYSAEPHRGDGLAAAIREILTGSPTALQIPIIYAGLNGEGLFAKEWGVAHIRNCDHFPPDARLEHPADCLGDTGTASGLLLTILAALDPRRSAAAPTLVWAASDHEMRATTLLR